MASSSEGPETEFRKWLDNKLTLAGLDSDVYVDYISGTLDIAADDEEESAIEEIRSQLNDILEGILTDIDCATFCEDIIQKWLTTVAPSHPSTQLKQKTTAKNSKPLVLQDHIKVIHASSKSQQDHSSNSSVTSKGSSLSKDEKKQLINQFGSCYESDDDEGTANQTSDDYSTTTIEANTNKLSVTAAIREKREEERKAHVEKKAQAKESRLLQQQKQQERKEKEKIRTQKRERKR